MSLTTAIGTALNVTSMVSRPLAGRVAFRLFGFPSTRGVLRDGEAEIMATARRETITVAGKTVHTYRWGDGTRPVLYVHGWRSRGSRVAHHVPGLLAAGYSPITFDAPAHGESPGRTVTIVDFADVIAALHAEHGHFEAVIAHSFGTIASLFAFRRGVTTGRLATIGGVVQFSYLLATFGRGLRLRRTTLDALRDRIRDWYFAGQEELWLRLDGTYRPEELTMPILAFHDPDDTTVELAQVHRLGESYGNRARVIITEGLGHNKIVVDPDVVAEILAFVRAGEGVRIVAGD